MTRALLALALLALPACLAPTDVDRQSFESNLQIYGDTRVRMATSDIRGAPSRDRGRIRMRFGANYEVEPGVTVGARLVTGSARDPKSPHVTLGDGLRDFEVSIDRAFVTVRPESMPEVFASFGKFRHPFRLNPVYGEIIWDADVQPEGFVIGRTLGDLGALHEPQAVLGGFVLSENASGTDAFAWAGQVSWEMDVTKHGTLDVALGAHHYTSIAAADDSTLLELSSSNALVDRDLDMLPDDFASDFTLLEALATYEWADPEIPLQISTQYVQNVRANIAGDTVVALGLAYGRAAFAGDWRGYYQWQEVGQDAVFSPFSQDDFHLASGYRGHVFGVQHQFQDKVGLDISLLAADDLTAAGRDGWRLRIDLNVKL